MRPATYGCQKCEAKYDMGDETTVHLYLKQPWFNHILTKCPGCDTTWRVWHLTEATVQYMEKHNMPEGDEVHWELEDFAPEIVQKLFAEDEDKPLIRPVERSIRRQAHDENEILFFHYLLERGETLDGRIPLQRDPGRTETSQPGAEGTSVGAV